MIGTSGRFAAFWIALIALGAGGCASRSPLADLPPIPLRTGALEVDVVYPPEGSTIAAVDSNFIFGSVGDGRASLTINGVPVLVEPNGAFLAWLPVPPAVADTLVVYELVAGLNGSRERVEHQVRLAGSSPISDAELWIDTSRVVPSGIWWAREGETLPLRVRATSGATVQLRLPSRERVRLVESLPLGEAAVSERREAGPSISSYDGTLVARMPLGRGQRSGDPPAVPATGVDPASACAPLASLEDGTNAVTLDPRCASIEIISGGDTLTAPLPVDLWLLEAPHPLYAVEEAPSPLGVDGLVAAEAEPGGTVIWLWSDGTRLAVTGRRNGLARVRLDSATEAWVPLADLRPLHERAPQEQARLGTVRVRSQADRVQVTVPVEHPVPYSILVQGESVSLTLHGAAATSGTIAFGPDDAYLEAVWWEQKTSDRYTLHVETSERPWGYRVHYAAGRLRLDLRRPPAIDARSPLRGRVIALDPGHPPAGATGPTRLYEGDANLAVAYRVRRLLEAEGAEVVMTRTDGSGVPLYDRVALAELLGAEILVSIHNNALPDGVEPFSSHGTSVYYFHPHEADLARRLQEALLESMGLRDLGVLRASLALARPIWLPSALVEGAFMMIPAHEAALRNPAFVEGYARGVVKGLREFLRGRAP